MKRFTFILLALAASTLTTSVGYAGGSKRPPKVRGVYKLIQINDSCQGLLDASFIRVSQSREGRGSFFIETTPTSCEKPRGTLQNNGDFTVRGPCFTCNGNFSKKVAQATCSIQGQTCQLTYKKMKKSTLPSNFNIK